MTYRAPISDILLALNHGAGLAAAVKAGHYGDFDGDITAAVLEEAGKFAGDVLAPLNRVGDEHGIKLEDNKVTTAPGWPDGFRRHERTGALTGFGPSLIGIGGKRAVPTHPGSVPGCLRRGPKHRAGELTFGAVA